MPHDQEEVPVTCRTRGNKVLEPSLQCLGDGWMVIARLLAPLQAAPGPSKNWIRGLLFLGALTSIITVLLRTAYRFCPP